MKNSAGMGPILLKIYSGRPPRYSDAFGGIDAFNARMSLQKSRLPLADVLRQRDEIHRRLIDFVFSMPEHLTFSETSVRRRLRLDTYGHYRTHAEAIWKWRKRPRPISLNRS